LFDFVYFGAVRVLVWGHRQKAWASQWGPRIFACTLPGGCDRHQSDSGEL